MRSPSAPAAPFVLTAFAILTAAACSSDVETLPPLGTDPSAEELVRHATRYCNRLESCAPAQANPGCVAKLTRHDDTAEGRQSSARLWNAFSGCMTLECEQMPHCFRTRMAKIGAEAPDAAPAAMPQPSTSSAPTGSSSAPMGSAAPTGSAAAPTGSSAPPTGSAAASGPR